MKIDIGWVLRTIRCYCKKANEIGIVPGIVKIAVVNRDTHLTLIAYKSEETLQNRM
jgi:hypothetical protein